MGSYKLDATEKTKNNSNMTNFKVNNKVMTALQTLEYLK